MTNDKYFDQYCPNPIKCFASVLAKNLIAYSARKD